MGNLIEKWAMSDPSRSQKEETLIASEFMRRELTSLAVIKNAIKISFNFTLNRGQKLSYRQSNADENGETESLKYC